MNALIDANLYGVEPEREPVATLVPGMPGSIDPDGPLIVEREDGGLDIHLQQAGPAHCCNGRMAYYFVNRNGVTRCGACDVMRD